MENILVKLKKYEVISLIVAICYFAGYFSFAYHYRVLGLGNVTASPLEYLTLGGDFFISSIIKVIKVPIDNPIALLCNLFFGDFKYVSWILILILTLKILKVNWIKLRIEKMWNFVLFGLLLAFNLLLIGWQSSNLLIDNVLTVHPQRIYLEFKSKKDLANCELLDETYQHHIDFLKASSPVYHRFDRWFNMKSTEDLSENRLLSYSSLCLLFIISIVMALTFKPGFTNKQAWSVSLTLLLMINFIFLPVSYGILGKSYQVPYSIIKFKTIKDSLQNRIYILREENDKYIVYDKLNFFQVKYIFKSNIKEIDQLFSLTPFQSPINKQSALCDSLLLIPNDLDH